MLKLFARMAIVFVTLALALGLASGLAQNGSAARTVPLQNFGWAPGPRL